MDGPCSIDRDHGSDCGRDAIYDDEMPDGAIGPIAATAAKNAFHDDDALTFVFSTQLEFYSIVPHYEEHDAQYASRTVTQVRLSSGCAQHPHAVYVARSV